MKKECVAMLLAGGQGSRLYVLTGNMAKPAVPFGGKFRITDFVRYHIQDNAVALGSQHVTNTAYESMLHHFVSTMPLRPAPPLPFSVGYQHLVLVPTA